MNILVLNCGSSSIKYKLYNMTDKSVMATGGIERIGLDDSFIVVKLPNGEKKKIMHDVPEHTEGVKFIFSVLTDKEIGAIKDLKEIDAVGHRMVHGGEKFNKSVILNEQILKEFSACNDLAPLHNPANLKGVAAVTELMPGLPQVGVFDTAFHQTMPKYAYMYAIPYDYYKDYGIRRYGLILSNVLCCSRSVGHQSCFIFIQRIDFIPHSKQHLLSHVFSFSLIGQHIGGCGYSLTPQFGDPGYVCLLVHSTFNTPKKQ